jgi:cytochrome b subunit of formate dehydrogenase
MRFWVGGPRILGLRTGVSFGPEDFRQVSRYRRSTRIPQWIKIFLAIIIAFIWCFFYCADSIHRGSQMYAYDTSGVVTALAALTAYAVILGFLKLLAMIF